MHHMAEVAVGGIPGKHGSKGALRRIRRRRRGRSASRSSFRHGRTLGQGNTLMSKVIRHAVPGKITPFPKLSDPGVR